MTSTHLELGQHASGWLWPARAVASAVQSLDRLLRDPVARRAVKVGVDFCCAAAAAVIAVAVGEGLDIHGVPETAALAALVGLLLVVTGALGGTYRTIWRYTSMPDAATLGLAGVVVTVALLTLRATGLVSLSAASILLLPLLMLFLSGGVRALRRWSVADAKLRARVAGARARGAASGAPLRRVVIAGAGAHGLSIGRELLAGAAPGVRLVGFLDDDPAKLGAVLNGVPVLGAVRDALAVVRGRDVREVIVAMPDAKRGVVRALGRQLEDAGIRVRAVGGIGRFVSGRDVHRPGSVTLQELLRTTPAAPSVPATLEGSRRVLVTGGAGFIGSHLTRMLLERGYHVRVLDRFDYGRAGVEGLTHPRLEVLAGDVCSSRDLSRALRDVYGVIALAAIVGDPACNLDPEETVNLNYTATKVLTEACNFYRVRRLVFASSCSVYGASSGGALTEESPLNPVSLYARTRVLSENILFDRAGDVEPVVLRLSTVFGLSPRMRFDLVVNTLTVRAVVDGKISIFGGDQWRPNVHCRDAARAFIAALEAPGEIVSGEVFNVGGDTLNHTIRGLGDLVAERVGNVTVAQQSDGGDLRDYRVSFAKIRRALGFVPEMTVAAGIDEVAAAVRASGALRNYQSPVYHNVQALKQSFATPRRRQGDWAPAREPAHV